MNKYATVKEMAEILSVSVDTIRRKAKAKAIPAIKIGSSFRFNPEHVIRSLEKQREPEKVA